jgi:hypothetical protein
MAVTMKNDVFCDTKKNPVHTSQEIHYISATDTSRLILCNIWCLHCSYYDECCLHRCYKIPTLFHTL